MPKDILDDSCMILAEESKKELHEQWRKEAMSECNISEESISDEKLDIKYGSRLIKEFYKGKLSEIPNHLQKYVDYILALPEEFEDIEPANTELSNLDSRK